MVQHLTDRQPALLTATDSTQLGLPRVGHALATFSRRYPVGVGAALVLCMIALLAVLAPMVAPYDPNFQHFNDLQQAPSAKYWLGTDYEGRDVLSRLIYGGRVSQTVAVLSVLLGTVVGSAWGVASAYLGGLWTSSASGWWRCSCPFRPWCWRWSSWSRWAGAFGR